MKARCLAQAFKKEELPGAFPCFCQWNRPCIFCDPRWDPQKDGVSCKRLACCWSIWDEDGGDTDSWQWFFLKPTVKHIEIICQLFIPFSMERKFAEMLIQFLIWYTHWLYKNTYHFRHTVTPHFTTICSVISNLQQCWMKGHTSHAQRSLQNPCSHVLKIQMLGSLLTQPRKALQCSFSPTFHSSKLFWLPVYSVLVGRSVRSRPEVKTKVLQRFQTAATPLRLWL